MLVRMLLENGRAMEFLNIEKYTYLEEKHRGYLDQLKDFCKKKPASSTISYSSAVRVAE